MAQAIKIRSGQVVKLELNDSCVMRLRSAWDKYSELHERIHDSTPGYSEFISRMIMCSVDFVNMANEKETMLYLIQQVSQ